MKIILETDRFLLREILTSDAADLFEMDSDSVVHQYLGNNPIQYMRQTEEMIALVRKQYTDNGIGRWAVIEKQSGDFVGWSGLKWEQSVRDFSYYDIGYRLKQRFWGKGIATETAIAALNYGFNILQLPKICAAADQNNAASNHILQKIGLKLNGTFESHGAICNWYELEKTEYLI